MQLSFIKCTHYLSGFRFLRGGGRHSVYPPFSITWPILYNKKIKWLGKILFLINPSRIKDSKIVQHKKNNIFHFASLTIMSNSNIFVCRIGHLLPYVYRIGHNFLENRRVNWSHWQSISEQEYINSKIVNVNKVSLQWPSIQRLHYCEKHPDLVFIKTKHGLSKSFFFVGTVKHHTVNSIRSHLHLTLTISLSSRLSFSRYFTVNWHARSLYVYFVV